MTAFTLNGKAASFEGDPEMPLLWHLREDLGLKGSKYSCGIGNCGACTVHINGRAARACVVPMSAVDGASIDTIEHMARDGELHPVQQAWIESDVPQCGYCQTGQIMAAIDLLQQNPNPSDEDIDRAMTNLCRCGTYYRIRKAIHRARELMAQQTATV